MTHFIVPCVQEVVTPLYIISYYIKWGNDFLDTQYDKINTLCSVPEEFKNVSTRLKKLQWKDVKHTFICGLHFEANLFKGKSQYRIDFSKAIADLSAFESQTHTEGRKEGRKEKKEIKK